MKILFFGVLLVIFTGSVRVRDSINFLFLGDWGGRSSFPYVTLTECAVAYEMGRIAKIYGADFVAALGDNFYYYGVKDIDDKRFKETFEDVFTSSSLQIPWYIIAGNHDHRGNVSAQIAYTKKSYRWNFPDFYYKKTFRIPHSQITVDLLMLDTTLLCENPPDRDVSHSRKRLDYQWTWVETNLKNSRADYLLVAGHHPIYSISIHGPTHCLVQHLQPLMYKYQATAYLCGHDHDMQHLKTTENGVTINHFLSGASDTLRSPSTPNLDKVPADALKFYWSDNTSLGAFAFSQVTKDYMIITFFESNGRKLYQYKVLPKSSSQN